MMESIISSIAVMGFFFFVTICVILIVNSRRKPDTRQPVGPTAVCSSKFYQDTLMTWLTHETPWVLEVYIDEVTKGFDHREYNKVIEHTHTWDNFLPEPVEIEARRKVLEAKCWEEYRVYAIANGRVLNEAAGNP